LRASTKAVSTPSNDASKTAAGAQVYEIQETAVLWVCRWVHGNFRRESVLIAVIVDFANSRVADQSALRSDRGQLPKIRTLAGKFSCAAAGIVIEALVKGRPLDGR
jgi:hypothetical protein